MGPGIKTETWVGWIAGIAVASAVLVSAMFQFAYGNFETKNHNIEMHAADREDMHRMENKLDELLNRPVTWPMTQHKPTRKANR